MTSVPLKQKVHLEYNDTMSLLSLGRDTLEYALLTHTHSHTQTWKWSHSMDIPQVQCHIAGLHRVSAWAFATLRVLGTWYGLNLTSQGKAELLMISLDLAFEPVLNYTKVFYSFPWLAYLHFSPSQSWSRLIKASSHDSSGEDLKCPARIISYFPNWVKIRHFLYSFLQLCLWKFPVSWYQFFIAYQFVQNHARRCLLV